MGFPDYRTHLIKLQRILSFIVMWMHNYQQSLFPTCHLGSVLCKRFKKIINALASVSLKWEQTHWYPNPSTNQTKNRYLISLQHKKEVC